MDILYSGGIRVAHMLHPLDVNEIRMIAVEKLLLQNRLMRSHETSQPNRLAASVAAATATATATTIYK